MGASVCCRPRFNLLNGDADETWVRLGSQRTFFFRREPEIIAAIDSVEFFLSGNGRSTRSVWQPTGAIVTRRRPCTLLIVWKERPRNVRSVAGRHPNEWFLTPAFIRRYRIEFRRRCGQGS